MPKDKKIAFNSPLDIISCLRVALEKEKKKYKNCPVYQDMSSSYEVTQGWGYVVAGYSLIEQSLKGLLYVRGKKEVPRTHSLSELFDLLGGGDQETLREYYTDCPTTVEGRLCGALWFKTLDEFLVNLDGNQHGGHMGSLDWRYFLIEETRSQKMPTVNIDLLHEIVYGCIRIISYVHYGWWKPQGNTRSLRLRSERDGKYKDKKIAFKRPSYIIVWLEAALEMEKKKYENCPVYQDLSSSYEVTQGWSCVVTGYNLIEQSLKGLLYVRGKEKFLRRTPCRGCSACSAAAIKRHSVNTTRTIRRPSKGGSAVRSGSRRWTNSSSTWTATSMAATWAPSIGDTSRLRSRRARRCRSSPSTSCTRSPTDAYGSSRTPTTVTSSHGSTPVAGAGARSAIGNTTTGCPSGR